MNKVYLMDCMEGMRCTPDKYYDLAVVDPPYGIGASEKNSTDIKQMRKSATNSKDYGSQSWDSNIPTEEYFKELFRVSKEQIIWGVNYYPYTFFIGGRIYWNKCVTMPTYSDGELAYCSLINSIKSVRIAWHGMIQHNMKNKETRIHPTQKPIALYDWIFAKYATKKMKILDTHAGSMSSVISAMKNEMQITAYEIDSDYFNAGKKRIETYLQQGDMFNQPKIEFIS